MTTFLTQALDYTEVKLKRELMALEAAAGHPNADIRLSVEVMNAARVKFRELGLDPKDTTAEELYHALQVRLRQDDQKLVFSLRSLAAEHVSAEADPVAGMAVALKSIPESKACFALKLAKLRLILKALSPKKTAKSLGYRSIDSMLKHESPEDVLAAAWLCESVSWQKRLLAQYRKLTPTDFEERSLRIVYAKDKRYHEVGKKIVQSMHHNLLSLKELGVIVLLPLPDHTPEGVVTASFSLAINELNEIRAASTFLKINQFKPGFGSQVSKVCLMHPELDSQVFDRPVPWGLVQRYYSRIQLKADSFLLEPYLSLDDLIYRPVEEMLARLEPSLAFWRNTDALGYVQGNKTVSLNILDNAINLCNNLSFDKRIAHYFQNSLWHELLMRYIKPESIENNLFNGLVPEYAV